jgi:ferrous iron transport protein A
MQVNDLHIGESAVIERIEGDERTAKFLGSLGCTPGTEITLVSILAGNYVVNIKDGRYALDGKMARSIHLHE